MIERETDSAPVGNTAEAVEFLNALRPGGPYDLVTIVPDGSISAKTFSANNSGRLTRFIEGKQGLENIYIHVNPLKAGVTDRKAKKEDVSEVRYLHVDIDDLDGYARLLEFGLPPTVVVCSGNGYHGYWLLKAPIKSADKAENCNRWLVEMLGGDRAATDVSRLLRVAGTVNVPNKVKRGKGRKPTLSYIVRELTDSSREYDIEQFGEVPVTGSSRKAVSVAQHHPDADDFAKISLRPCLNPRIESVIRGGDDPDNPRGSDRARYKSRSEAVFAIACTLLREGYTVEEVAGILINDEYGISESILDKKNPKNEAMRQARKALRVVGDDWPDGVNHSVPKRTFQNTQTAVTRLGIRCSYNIYKNRMYVEGEVLQSHHGEMTDKVCLLVRDLVNKRFGFDPGSEMTRDAVYQLCNENAYDPVHEYLQGLLWDGVARLDKWLVDFAGADDTAYVKAVGRIVLIAAVRRVRNPGIKFDTILVLEGPQGSGKSSLIKIMASAEYFSDQDLLALDAKAQMEALDGAWLFELCELAGMKHTDVNKIKAFASRSVDRGRPAYGRFSEVKPRRGILIGTTNDDQYLKDETGNRRFWPVRTGDIDTEVLSLTRDQLWAEAAYRESRGESIILPPELWAEAAIEQGQRVEPDPWDVLLSQAEPNVWKGRELLSSIHLLETVLKIPASQLQPFHYKRLSKVMKGLAWTGPVTITMESSKKMKGYWRTTTRPDDIL